MKGPFNIFVSNNKKNHVLASYRDIKINIHFLILSNLYVIVIERYLYG